MELIPEFFTALYDLSNAMAWYILFGLVFAGILHEVVPDTIVTKHLGHEKVSSVIKSTLFGIPLPVCSCGVIPLATGIKKSGASKGATLSFLISTPITGVDSILATYGMFGWVFTIYRVLTSMVIATFAGILANVYDKEQEKPSISFSAVNTNNKPANTQMFSSSSNFSAAKKEDSCESESGDSCCCENTEEKTKFSIVKAMRYAFITLLGDIAKPLFWGLVIGAIITIAIPENLSSVLTDYAWLSYLLVIAVAIPMYVCATASLPIAAAFMLSGVSAGAAFVFLTAGPATNTVTIGVVKKMLGTKSLYIYLGSITLGSIIFGLGLDYVFNITDIDPSSLVNIEEDFSYLDIASSITLWSFISFFMIKSYLKK